MECFADGEARFAVDRTIHVYTVEAGTLRTVGPSSVVLPSFVLLVLPCGLVGEAVS
ncbi:hypothetical protein Mapa_018705 [Marchantia paleacea]|nr:hypothetical protein Mapa_018705 [Marchantia paleacea]